MKAPTHFHTNTQTHFLTYATNLKGKLVSKVNDAKIGAFSTSFIRIKHSAIVRITTVIDIKETCKRRTKKELISSNKSFPYSSGGVKPGSSFDVPITRHNYLRE